MQGIFKNIIAVLLAILLIGALFALIGIKEEDSDKTPDASDNDSLQDSQNPSVPAPNVIGGFQGFTTDFSNMSIVEVSADQKKMLNKYGTVLPSQLFAQEGYGTITVDEGNLAYECTASGCDSTYPKFKLKPLKEDPARIYLYQFKVLTVDFDIEYEIDPTTEYASAFCALFNTRSDSIDSTVCSNSDYYRFDNSGKGHYTFVYYDTGDISTMKIFIYKDGTLVKTVSDFIYNTDYDAHDLYVSCLNIELTRNKGDCVCVDNIEFHYFDEKYQGPIMDLVKNPDVNLKTCKDSVLYGG